RGTVARVIAIEEQRPGTLNIHFNYEIEHAEYLEGQLTLNATDQEGIVADALVLATGYRTDPRLRPELQSIIPHLQFYEADAIAAHVPHEGGVIPELNQDFSFQARQIGRASCRERA